MSISHPLQAVAIRHLPFENLGLLAPVLRQRGFEITYVEAVQGVAPATVDKADLLIVLGGPIGVYEVEAYPFLSDELQLLRSRLADGRPTLGICLGAQLIAAALGSAVYPGTKEIGWAPVALTPAGAESPLAALSDDAPVLHWHGDTFDLPPAAVRLASTFDCINQAFAIGDTVLGLQFHLETPAQAVEQWLVGHASEISATPGVTVAGLRAETEAAAATEDIRVEVLARWIDGLLRGPLGR